MQRTPPCTKRGEEIRDTIIWLQALQLVRENPGTTVVFISGNTRQFATKDGELHPTLAAEATVGRLVYYSSLDAFAKQHATAIEFITSKWIEERITPDAVYEAAADGLSALAHRATRRRSSFAEFSIKATASISTTSTCTKWKTVQCACSPIGTAGWSAAPMVTMTTASIRRPATLTWTFRLRPRPSFVIRPSSLGRSSASTRCKRRIGGLAS